MRNRLWGRLGYVACVAMAAACGNDEVVPPVAVDAPVGVDAPVAVDAPVVDAVQVDAAVDATVVDAAVDAPPMAVAVSATSVLVHEPTGNGAVVEVTLSSQPPGPVDVAIASADASVATVTQATLSFTTSDWATPKTFRIDGTLDPDVLSESTTVTCTPSLSGWGAATIMVFVSDQSDPVLSTNPTHLVIDEGATGAFQVRISKMPVGTTNVTVTSADVTVATAAPAAFAIPAAEWNQDHPVTVTALQDADALDETTTIMITTPGLTTRTVTIAVNDDD